MVLNYPGQIGLCGELKWPTHGRAGQSGGSECISLHQIKEAATGRPVGNRRAVGRGGGQKCCFLGTALPPTTRVSRLPGLSQP